MILIFRTITLLLSCCAVTAWAESAVTDLAEVTGTNIGFVSAKLSEHQQGINAIALKRIDLIASVERMAAEGRLNVDREVAILKQTGGADLVKLLDALRDYADKAAAAPTQLDAVQAQAKKDITAVYKPLAVSTDKLDSAAKSLASLAKAKTREERAKFLISYLKEARDDVNKLKQESAASKDSGDQALDSKASKLEKPKQPNDK